MTMPDLEWFTIKSKLSTYVGAFVKFNNLRNCKQVDEIHEIIELEKSRASPLQNPQILGAHHVIEIFLVLYNIHAIPGDQEKDVFYVSNYIVYN